MAHHRTIVPVVLLLLLSVLLPTQSHCNNAALPPSIHQQIDLDAALLLSPFSLIDSINRPPISLPHRRQIIAAAISLLTHINPHKYLHRSRLNLNPVNKLKALSTALPTKNLTNLQFHSAMQNIFQMMNDKHTRYIAPNPLQNAVASTFFRIAQYYVSPKHSKNRSPRYVVASAQTLGQNGTFGQGSEILSYDGMPIHKAVKRLGRISFASNPAAQIDTGLLLLTARSLATDPFPEKLVIDIKFRNQDGTTGMATVPWNFLEIVDPEIRESVIRMHTPTSSTSSTTTPNLSVSSSPSIRATTTTPTRKSIRVAPQFRRIFEPSLIQTPTLKFGLIRFYSFKSKITPALIRELSRVLRRMPSAGLVLDLRGNAGGDPDFVKLLAEYISPKSVPFQPTVLRATPLMAAFLEAAQTKKSPKDIRAEVPVWRAAVKSAMKEGVRFTGPSANVYSNAVAKRRKQVYKGPVVTLVDGLTFSAGDIFAALQVDEGMSLLVGTSGNVGAGGASVMSYSTFSKTAPKSFPPLPKGVDISTAFARIFRTGKNEGKVLEGFGVQPQVRYYPTLNDALEGDVDLHKFLAKKLQGIRTRRRKNK